MLLVYHASYMRSQHLIDGSETPYFETLPGMWSNGALQQSTLLLLVWMHGCIGLHYWLRLGRFYRRIAPVLLGVAVLVPAMALAGFSVAGRQAADLAAQIEAEFAAATSTAVQATRTTADRSSAPAELVGADVRFNATGVAWAVLAARLRLHPRRQGCVAADPSPHPRQLHGRAVDY